MEARLLGFVDHAHTPTPELFDDAVVRDGAANHGQECTSVIQASQRESIQVLRPETPTSTDD